MGHIGQRAIPHLEVGMFALSEVIVPLWLLPVVLQIIILLVICVVRGEACFYENRDYGKYPYRSNESLANKQANKMILPSENIVQAQQNLFACNASSAIDCRFSGWGGGIVYK